MCGFNGVQQLAQVAISQLNDVFDNSNLNISAILTGVEILDGFVEPTDIDDCLDDLIIAAANDRDDHFADLVVMFSESYNTGAVGIAQGFGPPSAFAVVNENLATNVDFNNKPTGVANDRDNARRVNDNRCGVGNLRGDPPPPMLVSISGPHKAHNSGNYTWCATVSNCTNVSSYYWEYSTDGFNYSPWSTFHCNVASMPLNEDLFLRVTATCSDGRTAIDFFVTLNLDAPTLVSNQTISFRNIEFEEVSSKKFNVKVVPNPIPDYKISLMLQLPGDGAVSIILIDQLGRSVFSISKEELNQGNVKISKTLPHIPSGMYFLRTKWHDQVIVRKIILQ